MFFLTPRHVKMGRQFVKDARKLLAYKRDLVGPEVIAEVEKEITALETAVKTKDRTAIETQATVLDKTCGKLTQPVTDAGWRENVEVFMVAIIVALGVRTYFLQPFTIPTSSMFPTLNGIIFHETKEPPPNILVRALSVPVFGRHYSDFVAEEQEQVLTLRPAKSPLPFVAHVPGISRGPFDRTEIVTRTASGRERSYFVSESLDTMRTQFPKSALGRVFQPGEPIFRGYFDAGDHVFVDKMSYHFRKPKRGETFVFSTADIAYLKQASATSQYYIKRLAGVPGDTLQVRPPELFINGERAKEPGFVRVMSGTPVQPNKGYRGYGNTFNEAEWDQPIQFTGMAYLNQPDQVFALPPKEYFAMGDNSYNSSDSRVWGSVPERSLMGRALLVYWPFWPHFGLSK
jgi:signal peptidase I